MAALHNWDGQTIGDVTLKITLNIHSFFKDETACVRASTFALFEQLVLRAKEANKTVLGKEVVYSLFLLLLLLKDQVSTTPSLVGSGSPIRYE